MSLPTEGRRSMTVEITEALSQSLPVGVAGALVCGVPVADWLVMGSCVVLFGNLCFMGLRIYDRVGRTSKD